MKALVVGDGATFDEAGVQGKLLRVLHLFTCGVQR